MEGTGLVIKWLGGEGSLVTISLRTSEQSLSPEAPFFSPAWLPTWTYLLNLSFSNMLRWIVQGVRLKIQNSTPLLFHSLTWAQFTKEVLQSSRTETSDSWAKMVLCSCLTYSVRPLAQ